MKLRSKLLVLLLILAGPPLGGCGWKRGKVAHLPAPAPFEAAEESYRAGDYSTAIQAYETYLKQPDPRRKESALFHLAISYALRDAAAEDLLRARSLLDLFSREFPESSLLSQARLLSHMIEQDRRSSDENRRHEEQLHKLSQDVSTLLRRLTDLETVTEAERDHPLRRAERSLRDRAFKEAAELYHDYLTSGAGGPGRDEASFRLALIQLTPESGLRDVRAATRLLESIVRDSPESSYAPQAKYLLAIHRDINRLRSQVDAQQGELKHLNEALRRLKSIDLKRP